MYQLEIYFDAILIFVIFFLICLFGQFLKFIDNKRDKRNLFKLKKECPDSVVHVNGRVSKCVKMVHILCAFDDGSKIVNCVLKDLKNDKPSEIEVYINSDEVSFYKLPNSEKKTVRVIKMNEYYGVSVELDTREVIVESDKEFKKKDKIRLSKKVSADNFEIAGTEISEVDPEITHLVIHEPEILQYPDSFVPNIFVDVVSAAGITAFIMLGIAFVFKF